MFSALLGVLFLLIFLQSLIGCYFLLICPPFCFVVFCCNCCCCFFCVCFRVRLLFSHLNTFACLRHLQLATDKTVNQDHPIHLFPRSLHHDNQQLHRKKIDRRTAPWFFRLRKNSLTSPNIEAKSKNIPLSNVSFHLFCYFRLFPKFSPLSLVDDHHLEYMWRSVSIY